MSFNKIDENEVTTDKDMINVKSAWADDKGNILAIVSNNNGKILLREGKVEGEDSGFLGIIGGKEFDVNWLDFYGNSKKGRENIMATAVELEKEGFNGIVTELEKHDKFEKSHPDNLAFGGSGSEFSFKFIDY